MSALALTSIFASAFLHAGWNAILKRSSDQPAASAVVITIACVATVVLAVLVGPAHIPSGVWPSLLLVGALEGLYFVALSQALRLLPLGTAYGLSRGAGLLLVWPLSVAFFGETVELQAIVGALILSAGLFVLIQRTHSVPGLVAALLCALTIAAYPLAYKHCLALGVDPYPLFAVSLALALPIQLLALRNQRRERLRRVLIVQPIAIGIGGLLCAASFLLFLVALRSEGAGRITALRNSSVLFASLLGWLSGDPLTPRSVISALCVASGATLLAW